MSIIKAVFNPFFNRLIEHEGGYVNHPNDPGGETKYGVTKRVARRYGYNGSMRNIPIDTARNIAKELYWDSAQCDHYHPAIAWQVMDMAFNHGVYTAAKILQRAVNARPDGIIGNKTIAAVESMDINDVLLRLNGYRLYFYTDIRTWPTFGRGWARRVAKNLIYAAEDN